MIGTILGGYDEFTRTIQLISYDEEVHNIRLKNLYLGWLNDMDVVSSLFSGELIKQKDFDFINESFYRFTKPDAKGFFIKVLSQDKFVGTIKLDKITATNNSAEIGIMIGEKEMWGRKIGEKAYLILLKYAFEVLKLNRVWGGTDETNIGMQKLFIKTGFKEEGRLRQSTLFNGEYSDNIRYSILKEDYVGKYFS